jgi:hypothetical protein
MKRDETLTITTITCDQCGANWEEIDGQPGNQFRRSGVNHLVHDDHDFCGYACVGAFVMGVKPGSAGNSPTSPAVDQPTTNPVRDVFDRLNPRREG